jgi:hypothetical protein
MLVLAVGLALLASLVHRSIAPAVQARFYVLLRRAI